jgi:hypothetical protein
MITSRSSPCTFSRFLTNTGSADLGGEEGLDLRVLAARLVEQVLDQAAAGPG